MIILGLGFIGFIGSGIVAIGFSIWVLREHRDARKYRQLVRLNSYITTEAAGAIVKEPSWTVKYREGKKTRTIVVPGKTEGIAIRALHDKAIRYDQILSLEKV